MIADLISNFGDILYYLALLDYVLQIKNSNIAIMIINVSEIIPILFAFLIGYLADKNTKHVKTIISTLIIRCVLFIVMAFVIGFKPNLLIVVIISFINFICDLAGQYENGLYYPISNRLIRNEIREEVMAFRHSVTMTLSVLFQAAGGILICYVSFRNLAFINAATFFVSFLIVASVKSEMMKLCDDENVSVNQKIQEEKETEEAQEKQSIGTLLKSLRTELIESIKLLWKIQDIKETITTIPILNAGLAVVMPLVVLCMTKNADFCIINSELTISLLAISETVGRILGSALTVSVFKKIKLIHALKITMTTVVFLFIGMILKNMYIVLLALFLASLWTGCIDPKMGAAIFNNLDKNKLATTFGGMTTYFQLGDIASKGFFSILVLCAGSKAISIIYLAIMTIALVYLLFKEGFSYVPSDAEISGDKASQ